jgi:hypothetical protein
MRLLWVILFVIILPAIVFADATTQPLLQDGDITYLGKFYLPSAVNYGEGSLAVTSDDLYLYVNDDTNSGYYLARVDIPNPLDSSITTVDISPTLISGDPGGNGENKQINGVMVWGTDLIVQKGVHYDASGNSDYNHQICNLTLTSCGPIRAFSEGGVQYSSGYMGIIPTEWRTLLGGPAFAGNSSMSIISQCSNGPSFYVFDPDDIDETIPTPADELMAFTLANPILDLDPDDGNDWWIRPDQTNAGMIFPSGTSSVLFISMHGTGDRCYGTGAACSDPCREDQGEHAYPYRAQVTAFDANDLVDAKNGVIDVHAVEPYAWWVLPSFDTDTDNCIEMKYSGLAYNDSSRRIYITNDDDTSGGSAAAVYVYEVAEGTQVGSISGVNISLLE